jgi:hypothetical protein
MPSRGLSTRPSRLPPYPDKGVAGLVILSMRLVPLAMPSRTAGQDGKLAGPMGAPVFHDSWMIHQLQWIFSSMLG